MKIVITENEKNQISSKHEEFDSDILFFLMRRIKINERDLGLTGLEGDTSNTLKVTEYTFEGFPGFGFNNFKTKKDMMKSILNLLVEETDLIRDDWFELPYQDSQKQKVTKTIRKFLNNILVN